MDAGTAKEFFEAVKVAYAGWSWFAKQWYGTVKITHPNNWDIVPPDKVDVSGTHDGAKGIYWLLSPQRDEFFLRGRINLHPGGKWKESDVGVGNEPGPRVCVVSVVWVSEFMNAILEDIGTRSVKANYWAPVKAKPPKNHFAIVDSIALNIK